MIIKPPTNAHICIQKNANKLPNGRKKLAMVTANAEPDAIPNKYGSAKLFLKTP